MTPAVSKRDLLKGAFTGQSLPCGLRPRNDGPEWFTHFIFICHLMAIENQDGDHPFVFSIQSQGFLKVYGLTPANDEGINFSHENYHVTLNFFCTTNMPGEHNNAKKQKQFMGLKKQNNNNKKPQEDHKNESIQMLQGLMMLDIAFLCCSSLQTLSGDHFPVVILLPCFQTLPGDWFPDISKKKTPLFLSILTSIICLDDTRLCGYLLWIPH